MNCLGGIYITLLLSFDEIFRHDFFFRSLLFDLACLQNNEKLFNDPYIIFKN